MKITDPGPDLEYLVIDSHRGRLQVLKRNRAIRFDAFWTSEPVMEEDKPDARMTFGEIPPELWEMFNEEEKLTAATASVERENRRLKNRVSNLETYLFLAVVTIVSLIGAYCYSRFG